MAINQDMKAIVLGPKLGSGFLFYSLEALRDNLVKRFGRSGNGTRTVMGHEVAAFKISNRKKSFTNGSKLNFKASSASSFAN
jgi:hypothetical protein